MLENNRPVDFGQCGCCVKATRLDTARDAPQLTCGQDLPGHPVKSADETEKTSRKCGNPLHWNWRASGGWSGPVRAKGQKGSARQISGSSNCKTPICKTPICKTLICKT